MSRTTPGFNQKGSEGQNADQFRFRLARMDGARNPYRNSSQVPPAMYAALLQGCPKSNPLRVQLFGGLGDQLELLSLVVPWGSAKAFR